MVFPAALSCSVRVLVKQVKASKSDEVEAGQHAF